MLRDPCAERPKSHRTQDKLNLEDTLGQRPVSYRRVESHQEVLPWNKVGDVWVTFIR